MSNNVKHRAFLDPDSETFSYVLYDEQHKQGVIVDPVLNYQATSGRTSTELADEILHFVSDKNLQIKYVLETHAHADHLSAGVYLKQQLNAKIGIGEKIIDVQTVFKSLFNFEKEFLPNGEQFDHLFSDGETINVGHMHIKAIHTPGHTPADLVYLVNDSIALVGDTLFMPDVGTARCDFPGGSASQLFQSIKTILSLPEETQLLMCHDYPPDGRTHKFKTTVKEQREKNIHINDTITQEQFIKMREKRDASLPVPRLLLPSVQINIRAGQLPPAEDNGVRYIKIPINKI